MATVTIRPNADSPTHDGVWTLVGGTAGLAYTTIDEVSPDDTDYITNNDTTSTYDRQAVELENMPGASAISSVIIWFRSRCASSTLAMIPFYRLGGTDTDKGTAVTVSTTPTDYSWDVTADRTWTDADINGLEIGWRRNTGASNALRITQAWVVVTYTPGAVVILRPSVDYAGPARWSHVGGNQGYPAMMIYEAVTDDANYVWNNRTEIDGADKRRLAVHLDNLPGDAGTATIVGIVVHYRSKSGVADGKIRPYYHLYGAHEDAAADVTLSTTVTEYTWDITSLRTWTPADINALIIGWYKPWPSGLDGGAIRITQAWVVVTYTSGARSRAIPVQAVLAVQAIPLGAHTNETVTGDVFAVEVPCLYTHFGVYITAMADNGAAGSLTITAWRIDGSAVEYPISSGSADGVGEFSVGLETVRPTADFPSWRVTAEVSGDVTFEVLAWGEGRIPGFDADEDD